MTEPKLVEKTPTEKLEEFLEKESLTIALVPQFGLGDDGRIIFKGSIQVNKKALV